MDNRETVKRARHVLQMTQKALSSEMGVSNQHLNAVECGKIAATDKFMNKVWAVIDTHGAREAVTGNNDLLLMFNTLSPKKQQLILDIVRALAGRDTPDVEAPPEEIQPAVVNLPPKPPKTRRPKTIPPAR